MKQLDYFPFYYSYADRFSDLTDEELGRAIRAVCCYGMGKEIREEDRLVSMALKTIAFDLDRARENYAEQLRRRQEGGRLGAARRWGTGSPDEAAASEQAEPGAYGYPMGNDGCIGKSKSKSKSKGKSKSKSKSDSSISPSGGVGGEAAAREDFLELAGEDPELRARMEAYLSMLAQKGRRLTPEALAALGRKLLSYPAQQRLAVLDQSIRNGWNDLYDLPAPTRGSSRAGGDAQRHGEPLSPFALQAVRKMMGGRIDPTARDPDD